MFVDQRLPELDDFVLARPDIGADKARLIRWHVNLEESVEVEQPLASVETDKVNIDVLSPRRGTVVACHAAAGDLVRVGRPFATFTDMTVLMRSKTALEEVLFAVEEIIRPHQAVLAAKRRQKIYVDDYQRIIDTAWRAEIDYFSENVIDGALSKRFVAEVPCLARLRAMLDALSGLPPGSRIASDSLADRIKQHVDVVISQIDPTISAKQLEQDLSPAGYERICASILEEAGWAVRVCGRPGDQGVDIVAERDGIRAVFQCKRHSRPVGNGAVQEVHTGKCFHRAHLAAVVGTMGFTASARAAAAQTGVLLLNEAQLAHFPSV